jgi:hypothetical protein
MAKRRKKSGAGEREVAVAYLKDKPCWTIIATGLPDIDAARDWARKTRCRPGCTEIAVLILCQQGNCTAIKTCRAARR